MLPIASQRGKNAEQAAKKYLSEQGLLFVTENYYCRLGEIDLIFRDNKTLVFVEVRYRRSTQFGSAIESVDYRKQQKIIRTALYYLQREKCMNTACRFDIVSVEESHKGYHFQWIKNAFSTN